MTNILINLISYHIVERTRITTSPMDHGHRSGLQYTETRLQV